MAGRLDGKVAVITGAGSGIGAGMAAVFHREGAKVVLADLTGAQEAVAKELGAGASAVHADVRSGESVQAMIATAVSTFGKLDVLCNNAGIDGELHKLGEMPEEAWDAVQAVNLRGVFLGMRYGIPAMLASGGGSIINTASMAAMVAFPNMSSYCAAKAGVVMLTKTAATEYAGQNIRVNAINPGTIRTGMTDHLPAEMIEAIINNNPIRRFATPEEVGNLALFLAGDESLFITGTEMVIDGGYTCL